MNKDKVIDLIVNLIALLTIIVIVILVVAFAMSPEWTPAAGTLGMLGNPFRTTRKMKVPMRNRVGHRERSFINFAKIAIILCISLLALGVLVRAISNMQLY